MKRYLILYFILLFVSCKHTYDVQTVAPLNDNYNEMNGGRPFVIEDVAELPLVSSTPTVIKIPEHAESTSLKEYISSYHYIPLETSDSSLIGSITKLCADDSLLFVFDRTNNLALRFSYEGNFMGHLGQKGRGPGEFIDLCDLSLDKSRKEVCLLDLNGGKQIFYKYDGTLIREQPLYFYYNRIEFLGDKQFLSTSYANNERCMTIDAYRLVVADENQIPLYKAFPFPPKLREDFHWETEHPLQHCDNRLYYNHIASDTIWSVSTEGYRPEYVLDFGYPSPFIPKDGKTLITDEEYQNLDKNNVTFSGMHLQGKEVACFYISDKEQRIKPLLYNKQTGNILYGLSSGTEKDGFQRFFLSGVFNFVVNDTSFIQVLEPFRIMKWVKSMKKFDMPLKLNPQDKQLLQNLDAEDNPVLVVAKLKPF
ncbi:MAG: 6-bladed beta-propeller [Paraprevotella sp.]|nr:6-bladed beta-propeller [Paraprevotella sp.]MBP3470793.1 6-bladed beta-propeller [Paraprevotella sp.]